MNEALSIALLEQISRFFLRTDRFSGIPLATLADRQQVSLDAVREALRPLIRSQLVVVEFGDRYPDPYVRALHEPPIWFQMDRLDSHPLDTACAYPSQRHLERVVDIRAYNGRPYTLRLALGSPRLAIEVFHPSVLAYYLQREDRSLLPAVPQATRRPPPHGMAFDTAMHRAIAACVGDLADLPPMEQQHWRARTLQGSFRVHPDFERALYGHGFSQRISLHRALEEELHSLNRYSAYLRRPLLFPHARRDSAFLHDWGPIAHPNIEGAGRFLTQLQVLTLQNLDPAFFGEDDVTSRIAVGPFQHEVNLPATPLERLDLWMVRHFGASGPAFRPYLHTLRAARRRMRRIQLAYTGEGWEDILHQLQRHLLRSAYTSFRAARKHFEQRIGQDQYLHPAAREELVWMQ